MLTVWRSIHKGESFAYWNKCVESKEPKKNKNKIKTSISFGFYDFFSFLFVFVLFLPFPFFHIYFLIFYVGINKSWNFSFLSRLLLFFSYVLYVLIYSLFYFWAYKCLRSHIELPNKWHRFVHCKLIAKVLL